MPALYQGLPILLVTHQHTGQVPIADDTAIHKVL